MHMIGSGMMVSVRQRSVELQAAIEAFMPSPDACLEICELLIIRRIWQRQLDMMLRLSLRSIHPVGDYLLSMWYLVPQTHFSVNCFRAAHESECLAHDRRLFPRQTENHRGEPVFDLSAAKLLLRADVEEGKHNQLTPSQLQASRLEYHPFNAKKFKHHIYQEVRRQKFINYLNQRRAQA